MKIKTDFITNSSSTMYIFYIPESFKLDEKEVCETMLKYEYTYHDFIEEGGRCDTDLSYKEYMLKNMPGALDELRRERSLWSYHNDGCPPMLYYCLLDILKKNNLNIDVIEIGSEGSNQLFSVDADKIKNIFLAEALSNIQIKGECKDVKKD